MALTVTRRGGICTTFLLGAGHACAAFWLERDLALAPRRASPAPRTRAGRATASPERLRVASFGSRVSYERDGRVRDESV